MDKQITVTVKSESLANAIDRYKGGLDDVLSDILKTVIGDYENVLLCKDWSDRNRVYTRNGFRKTALTNLKKWMEGEII